MTDPYFAYVASAFGVSGLALAALVLWTLLDGQAAKRRLAQLEAERERSRAGPRA